LKKRHHRPPWIETNIDQYDLKLCSIGRGASDERFRQETARILENKYKHHIKVYTDGSKEESAKNHKRIWPQNTIFSAEQSAIITGFFSFFFIHFHN
jgi:hypothetical protein